MSQPTDTAAGYCNLLADRHDTVYRRKPDLPGGPSGSYNYIINSGAKGNAAFCDGHVEFATRSKVHSYHYSCADAEGDAPGYAPVVMK